MNELSKVGYRLAVGGLAIVLLWIGIFKFTPTEANAIKGLVENSPFMGWMYSLLSLQAVSNIIGSFEIIAGSLLLLSFRFPKAGVIGGAMAAFTFIGTLSFLFTTPGINTLADGIWIPNQFILKDVMALGLSLLVIGNCREKISG